MGPEQTGGGMMFKISVSFSLPLVRIRPEKLIAEVLL
jgi:hypothetical protein